MKKTVLAGLISLMPLLSSAQDFLHADGKNILNGQGENVILRGIGTGNWMLQEGYMMKSVEVAGTQHEFREKLVNTIGEVRTDSFYGAWLANHFTRADADSLAAWGFNSVRVAMHYKWFTLPIEEEVVQGEQTWLDTGFVMIDSLLDWCGDNEIYLILDMHGTPGGQGKDQAISDYDPSKPSLWENQANQDKLVALWKKLAERYAEEPWIGGYDLINETNWELGSANADLRSLYERLTDSIRKVDPNHILFIEGNDFANNFSGLTPPWDGNMVYSFHKYRTYNTPASISWVTSELRDRYNVPIWLGESGEDSNTWGTNMVRLCESLNIGWVWWPLKKGDINSPLKVDFNEDYYQLLDNWAGNGPMLSEDEAYQAVMTFAERHHISRCHVNRDVVDALFRQPYTTELRPYTARSENDIIYASEYDYGRNGHAYMDMDTADYQFSTGGDFVSWNRGWAFRNDGVDLESCDDETSNGYSVGWTETGEWMVYGMDTDSVAAYDLQFRTASGSSGALVHLEIDGVDVTGPVKLPATGGWYSWQTSLAEDIMLPGGNFGLKLVFDEGGSNLNWFRFINPRDEKEVAFRALSAVAGGLEQSLFVVLNKEIDAGSVLLASDFTLAVGGQEVAVTAVELSETDSRVLLLKTEADLLSGQLIAVTYTGSGIVHGQQSLLQFFGLEVQNKLPAYYPVPGKIQAESFFANDGLELETCSDVGGGQNTGYADIGDYLEYLIVVEEAGEYVLDFRVATPNSNARLSFYNDRGDGFEVLGSIRFTSTGGWQTWQTQSVRLNLPEGKQRLRMLVTADAFNLNWFQFHSTVGVEEGLIPVPEIYPNPISDHFTVDFGASPPEGALLRVHDAMGRQVWSGKASGRRLQIDASLWEPGMYFLSLEYGGSIRVRKLLR